MNRIALDRVVLLACFVVSFASTLFFELAQSRANEPEQPNILWLSVEDVGPQIGCYGFDIKTPTLDALAKRSLTYDIAWSNYPVCAPARTTIISGMYATSLGAGNMRCAANRADDIKLLPTLMREAGYYCTNASKTDYNFSNLVQSSVWDQSSGKAHWRNRPEGKPFFAVFNNTKTHESKIRNRPHENQIDPASVSLFPYWPDLPQVREDWAQYLDNIQTMDSWVARHLKQLDDAGLTEDTIVVFFGDHGSGMPRHKRFAGDSGMRVPFIVHVPEKWKKLWSAEYSPGQRTDRPVGFIDLAPSMLHAAGAEIPDRFQGKSFFDGDAESEKYVYGIRNRMDERNDVSRSLRDGQFIYIRNFMPHRPHGQFVEYQQTTNATRVWHEQFKAGKLDPVQSAFWEPRAAEELFDLKNDPYETVNLAADPKHAETVARMRVELKRKLLEIGDLDLVPESILHEFDTKTGKARTEYRNTDTFSAEALLSSAMGESTASADLKSSVPEIRFWGLVKLMNQTDIASSETDRMKELLSDDSMAVQVAAAEACLANEIHVADSIELLMKLSDKTNSNYYVSCNALDCLDRYRKLLGIDQVKKLASMPTEASEIRRGTDNLEKMVRRFQ
jgi:uncharacterized sulfatase